MEIAEKHYLANGTQPRPDEAIAWASETKAKMVDLKFCDLLGSWQHMTMPLRALDAGAYPFTHLRDRRSAHPRAVPPRPAPDRATR